MTDLTPRETVARAIRSVAVGPFGPNALAIVNQGGSTRLTPREAQDMADAALTALADHPGLAEVLRGHIPCTWTGVTTPDGLPIMTCGRGLPAGPDRLSAHLADVIRAWLRGAS